MWSVKGGSFRSSSFLLELRSVHNQTLLSWELECVLFLISNLHFIICGSCYNTIGVILIRFFRITNYRPPSPLPHPSDGLSSGALHFGPGDGCPSLISPKINTSLYKTVYSIPVSHQPFCPLWRK